MRHEPWSRNTRLLALLFAILLLTWVAYSARVLLGPLLVAALVAYVLNPVVTTVNQRSHLPRAVVISLIYLLSLAVLVVLLIVFVPLLAEQGQAISEEWQHINDQLRVTLAEPILIMGFELPAGELLGEVDMLSTNIVGTDRILQLMQAATTNLVWVLVILVVAYYLLMDWERLRDWLFGLAPVEARVDLLRLYTRVKQIWRNYLRGQLVLMVAMALMTWLVLAASGMRGAAAVAVLTGLLDVIPTIGPTLAMLVAGVVAWSEGSTFIPLGNPWFPIVVMGLHGLVQGVENVWLRPKIMGQRLRIHPAVVFLGIIGALTLVGIVGALVVVPAMGTAGVIGGYLRRRILGLPPWPEEGGEASAVQEKDGATESNGAYVTE